MVRAAMSGLEIHIVVGPEWILLTFMAAFAIVFIKALMVAIDAAWWVIDWWHRPHWWKPKKEK